MAQTMKLIVLAVPVWFVSVLAMISTARTVPWVTFKAKNKTGGTTWFDSEIIISLYKLYREDKGADGGEFENDDITQIDDDDFQNYQAFEVNRFTTILTILVTLGVGFFYLGTGLTTRRLKGEFYSGLVMLALTVMCWAGSGYWHNRMVRDFYKARERQGYKISNEVNCSAGCALQFVNSFFCLLLGITMLLIYYFDSKTTSDKSPEHKSIEKANKDSDKKRDDVVPGTVVKAEERIVPSAPAASDAEEKV